MKFLGSFGFSAFTAFLFTTLLTAPVQAADNTQQIIQTCESCHGPNGASKNPDVPIIGGMSDYYLEAQIEAYQKGLRPCPDVKFESGPNKGQTTNMCKEAKSLNDQQAKAVTKYFASKPFVPAQQSYDKSLAQQGKKIYESECSRCHSAGGAEPMDDAGILAGQWRNYLVQNFQYDRQGKRWMPEKMKPKINALSDQQVKALIEFFVSEGAKQ